MYSRRCVSRFNLPSFLQPNLFHYHRCRQFYHHASGHSKGISQYKRDAAQNFARPPPHRPPHPPRPHQSTSALGTSEPAANVRRCAGDCAYRCARRRARSRTIVMPCVAQYPVSPGNWHTNPRHPFVCMPRGCPDSRRAAAPQRKELGHLQAQPDASRL